MHCKEGGTPARSVWGTPIGTGWGYPPSPVWTAWMGIPAIRTGWGYSHHLSGLDGGTPPLVGQDGVPPLDGGTPSPAGQDGVPPPPQGDRTAQRVLATQGVVCLLRSRRISFLFLRLKMLEQIDISSGNGVCLIVCL